MEATQEEPTPSAAVDPLTSAAGPPIDPIADASRMDDTSPEGADVSQPSKTATERPAEEPPAGGAEDADDDARQHDASNATKTMPQEGNENDKALDRPGGGEMRTAGLGLSGLAGEKESIEPEVVPPSMTPNVPGVDGMTEEEIEAFMESLDEFTPTVRGSPHFVHRRRR